jgi:glycosyltransferase involved in cell wall biosynthesis
MDDEQIKAPKANRNRVLFIRSDSASIDPRVTKEVSSLLLYGYDVSILDWDREKKGKLSLNRLAIGGKEIQEFVISVKAPWGAGPKKNFKAYVKFTLQIQRFVRRHYREFDFFHLCDLPTGFPLYPILKHRKKPYIYDIFDYFPDQRNFPSIIRKILISWETKTINNADGVIICSETRRQQIGNCHPKLLKVIHNSPKREFCDSVNDNLKEARTPHYSACYIGSLVKERLICQAVNAFDNTPFSLLIGGRGYLENNIREKASISKNISFVGKLPYKEVINCEQNSDFLIALYDPSIPNHHYTAPNKFYEALALGKPLLMCKGAGFDSFVEEYPFIYFVEPTEESIRSGISRLMNDRAKWPQYAEQEKNLFLKKYCWEIMEKNLISLYQEISLKENHK